MFDVWTEQAQAGAEYLVARAAIRNLPDEREVSAG
jgi:hypothetical protein